MTREPMVFLDMDGILCDFMTQLHSHLDLPYGIYDGEYPYAKDEFLEVYQSMPVTRNQIKKHQRTEAFWSEMPWMGDGQEILAAVRSVVADDRIFLLTHPPVFFPQAYAGKVKWVMKNIPELSDQVIPTGIPKGEVFADPSRVLIDDWTKNTDSFTKWGGSAILIPRPWNRLHKQFDKRFDAYRYVRSNLLEWRHNA